MTAGPVLRGSSAFLILEGIISGLEHEDTQENKKLISRRDSICELSCARKRLCWNAGLPNSVK